MLSQHDLYDSDCHTKLALAQKLHQTLGTELQTEHIRLSLTRLKEKARELSELMADMGLGRICAACAAKPNGGCCSRAITDENDTVQLLMNLMASIQVEVQRDNGHECLFLGYNGCTLAFKPFYCLNYDCQAIKEQAKAQRGGRYDHLRGALLQEQWRLEQLLLELMAQLGKFR